MAIMVSDSGGGGDFSPMPQGNHVAICNMVVDLGLQRTVSQMYGEKIKRQVYVRWETPDERISWTDKEGNEREGPRVIGQIYTASLHENAKLRGDLESWRGRPFTQEELAGFDISKLLGVPCMVNVTHAERNGKTYANVAAVTPLPKALRENPPKAESSLLIYDEDNPGSYDLLPEWLQKKIDDQVRQSSPPSGNGGQHDDDLNDDIPF